MYACIQLKYLNADTLSTAIGKIGFILAILVIAGYFAHTLYIYYDMQKLAYSDKVNLIKKIPNFFYIQIEDGLLLQSLYTPLVEELNHQFPFAFSLFKIEKKRRRELILNYHLLSYIKKVIILIVVVFAQGEGIFIIATMMTL